MPTSTTSEVPPELWSLIHDLLSSSGMSKVAKSLSKRVEVDLPSTAGMDSLLTIFNKYQADHGTSDKKRKKSTVAEADSTDERSKKKKKQIIKAETPPDQDSEQEEAEKPDPKDSKKERKGKDDKSAKEAGSPAAKESNASNLDSASKKSSGSNSSPFQRVKSEEVTYLKVKGGKTEAQRLKDNTFESKGGDVFGAKASEILVSVRGKDFRHEKTKKKRSFRSSGPIDMNSNSVKFDSDSE